MEERIGRYQILEEIASGGQGSVHRAFDSETGQIVAVKVLHSHLSGDTDFLERFHREARLAASIDHPNVIRIFEVGQQSDTHFISMEFLPDSLANVIDKGGALPLERAVEFAVQIAAGLSAAHALGIVHRDVKPQNVLIGPDGTAKVTDFGIARAQVLPTMTATGAMMGTPHYMSPEQARGERADARSDVYSLGCILYQMLTGDLPFKGNTPYEVMRQHIEVRARPIRELQRNVPRGVVGAVERAMAKDASRRFQTPLELTTALYGAVPQLAPEPVEPQRASPPPPPGPPRPRGAASGDRPRSPAAVAQPPRGGLKWWHLLLPAVLIAAGLVVALNLPMIMGDRTDQAPVVVEREVVKEVPVEVIIEKEVVKEVPVERIVEVEVVKAVEVEKPVVVEKEVVRAVEVEKPVVVEKEVIREVEVEKLVVVEKEVIKEVPVEVVKEVVVVKEVPVEVIKEVVVVKEVEKIVVATAVPVGAAPWMINLSEATLKWGGHLVHGTHGPMSQFDLYQSGSIANIGPQGPMYDSMLRVDPHHPMTPVIGDLAYTWDIASDGMTYTFKIREGVKFHDGTDLTADDVVASLNRVIFPDMFQEGLFARGAATFRGAVDEITATDDFTVQMTLAKPRNQAFIMGNLANGFNVVTTKEALDENKGDLKSVDTYPGTGPYIHVSRDSEKWVQDKFTDYWNPNAGFLDKLTNVWFIAYSAPMAAAMEGGAVDFADYIPPGAYNTMLERGHGGMEVFSGFITSVGFNNGKAPTDDQRVREAFALVIDAVALNTATEDIWPRTRAGWFDVGTPFARTPSELDKIRGFRSPTEDDIAHAKQLLVDAGYPGCQGMPVLEIPTRDLPDARILVPAVQAMLKQNLGCESETSIHQTSAIGEVINEGKFHIVPSTMGSHGVPGSAGGAALRKCDEPDNTLRYCNREFDKVVDAFLVETDSQKANELKLQIRDFWDADWPWVPYGETPILYGWYSWVKGFPAFSVSTYEKNLHKLDWVWTTKSR